ncbi:MAG: hypothetical protein J7M38_03850, partial [Armatimonadetes bacterium]|nr:hypothetical protein [Armatimonadota bacterium]
VLSLIPRWLTQRRARQPLAPSPSAVVGPLALMFAAVLLNPNGPAGALYPLEYVTGGCSYHKDIISEYSSPDFSAPMFAFLGPYVLVLVAGLALSEGIGLFDLAVALVFLLLALRWERNVALFVFATAPIAAAGLSDFVRRRLVPAEGRARDDRESSLVHGLVIAGLLVSALFALRAAPARVDEVFSEDYPTDCLQVIREHDLRGNMFNTYRWGGYLIWNLWPEHKVFIDGRADVMGRDLMSDWIRCHRLEPGWREVLDKYQVDWLLLTVKSPLCRALRMSPDFELLHAGADAELFVRRRTAERLLEGESGT